MSAADSLNAASARLAGMTAAYESQEKAKREAGRYTIREAAELLQQHAGERADSMVEKLSKAAFAGTLPMYRPGENARLDYAGPDWRQCVRDFYEEAYWDGLNAWLKESEPRITWRFPAPVEDRSRPAKAPAVTTKSTWEEAAQDIALEYIRRHEMMNLFPSQSDVCEAVAKEMRERKIYGHHGKPLEANYIQRNAIQGKWWNANKPK